MNIGKAEALRLKLTISHWLKIATLVSKKAEWFGCMLNISATQSCTQSDSVAINCFIGLHIYRFLIAESHAEFPRKSSTI
jgi:hypothetical protein